MDAVTLYDTNKANKTKVWSIGVSQDAIISTTYGQLDGKQTINQKQISAGKNIGKKNETTPLQQAIAEAKATIVLKMRSGYKTLNETEIRKENEAGAIVTDKTKKTDETDEIDKIDEGLGGKKDELLLPMLLNDYNKCSKHISFPCYTQPKIDGIRSIYQNGEFHSRGGKLFGGLDHITNVIPLSDAILDGELYSYTLPFEQLVGTIKKVKKSAEDVAKIQQHVVYLVFDIVDETKTFDDRFQKLECILKDCDPKIIFVETKLCNTPAEVNEHYMAAMQNGMEGLVLRNKNGMYRPKYRSLHVQKLKEFESDEYKVVDFTEGSGSDKGTIIFICEIPSGKTFNARPRGTVAERKQLFLNGSDFIGKFITIRYQELTTAGIPRFPVALAVVRDNT